MTAAAGFLLAASVFGFSWIKFFGVVGGVSLVIASACVLNNILDRDIDARMSRTKNREIAAGNISLHSALVYAILLGLAGLGTLYLLTNTLTVLLGIISYGWYVGIYGLSKRTTPLSTAIGAVCGALPPMAGYTALSGQVDGVAWSLFWILMIWQLPHFYAIAIFRANDYKEAGLPVWSVLFGAESTRAQILFWAVVFVFVVSIPTIIGVTGYVYLAIMLAVSMYWAGLGAWFYRQENAERWSKRMFGVSLVVLLVFCATISLGGFIA